MKRMKEEEREGAGSNENAEIRMRQIEHKQEEGVEKGKGIESEAGQEGCDDD